MGFPVLALAESTGAPGDACDQEVGSGLPPCISSAVKVPYSPLRKSPCPHPSHQSFQKAVWLPSHQPFRGGESHWGVGVPVPVGAGSPGRPLLVRPGLSPLLLSPARSSSAGQSLLLGSWGRVMCSVSRYRSPVRWFGSLTRSWSDSAPHCRSRIRLFGCSARC